MSADEARKKIVSEIMNNAEAINWLTDHFRILIVTKLDLQTPSYTVQVMDSDGVVRVFSGWSLLEAARKIYRAVKIAEAEP